MQLNHVPFFLGTRPDQSLLDYAVVLSFEKVIGWQDDLFDVILRAEKIYYNHNSFLLTFTL